MPSLSLLGPIGGPLAYGFGESVGRRMFGGRRRRRRRHVGLSMREITQLLIMKSILGVRHPATMMYGLRAIGGRM